MYQQTAGVWARGILQDEHALDLDSMTWCTGQLATLDGGERQPLNLPEHVSVEPLGIGRSLVGALDAGDIDAIISPWVPPEFRERRGTIRRLFDDFPKRDREYFAKTGVFPPMHLVVIRSGVYQQNRWLAKSLVDAFDEAKRIALADIADISYLRMMVPFVAGLLEEQLAIFGADPWPYGVEENRRSLEVFVRYMGEQGLLESPISVEDLFAEEVITA